ncbi:MAG: polyprenyl synthetase family protein [Proteobacteria bacterium]|nr:polyprenyl synthetase family protein [Pseudomonadota bacterium]
MSLEQSTNELSDLAPLSALELDPHVLISEALQPVAEELNTLNEAIKSLTGAQTSTARDVVNHVFAAGGKRIRPALFFFSARLAGYSGHHLINMAAVCELVHSASLLHDDVIDNSSLRRNKPTSNSIWGDEASVLTGDLIYARASEMMAATGSLEIVSIFARAIRLMSEGELLQLEHLYNPVMSEESYFEILENKTGALLAAACRAPAVLAQRQVIDCDALESFGRHLGFAFQLLDDALDYCGSPEVFGKRTLSDLPEGKVTLPVILLRTQSTPEEWTKIEKIIRKIEIGPRDMGVVQALVEHYDTAGQTLERAATYTNAALAALEMFPPSPERQNLERLANRLLMRVQ